MTPLYNNAGLLLSVTSLFWAGNVIVGRAVAGMIPPITLSCLRWTLATFIFLPFAWSFLRRDWALVRKSWLSIMLFGIIGPGCYNTLSYMGLAWTEALNGLILNAAGPIFIALVSWGIFGDRLRAVQVAGLAMGFFGVLAVIAKGDLRLLTGLTFGLGDIVLIIGMIMWSIYTACLRLRPDVSWQSFSATTYGVAAIGNLPLAAIELTHGGTMSANSGTIAAVSYTAIFPSLIAYMCYNRGVAILGATRAGLYLFLVPVFGALFAMIILGEQLHLYHASGFILIIAGVLLGTGSRDSETAITQSGSVAGEEDAPR